MTTCKSLKDLDKKSLAVWEALASKYCISEESHKDIFNTTQIIEQESIKVIEGEEND
jgi:hypothetical protein